MLHRRVQEAREDEAQTRRAVCGERRMHGSVGGGWKRAARQRAGRLPFTSRKVAGISGTKSLRVDCSVTEEETVSSPAHGLAGPALKGSAT